MRTIGSPTPLRVTFRVKLTPTRQPRCQRKRRATPTLPRSQYALVLGHQIERGIQTGEFASHADAAAMIHRTTMRVSQLTSLTRLAPDIQRDILSLPDHVLKRIREKEVRQIVAELAWAEQRKQWADLVAAARADCESAPD